MGSIPEQAPGGYDINDEVTVLVTGFGPFLQNKENASWSIASTLPPYLEPNAAHPTPIRLVVHPSPLKVAYNAVLSQDPEIIASVNPDIILHIGLAAGRSYFTLERGAHRDSYDQIADVDGHKFSAERTRKAFGDCPAVLRPTFRVEDVWRRWRSELADPNIDVRPSEDAGNFLCGFIYYTSLAYYWKRNGGAKGERPVMFMHVPLLPREEDVAKGRMVAEALIRGLVDSRRQRAAEDGLIAAADLDISAMTSAAPTDVNFR